MRNNPNITVPEIVTHLTIARSAVMKHIKRLKDQGLIERIGPDKGGHWRVLRDD
jgi:ATP-dependent DNA helicase RecG